MDSNKNVRTVSILVILIILVVGMVWVLSGGDDNPEDTATDDTEVAAEQPGPDSGDVSDGDEDIDEENDSADEEGDPDEGDEETEPEEDDELTITKEPFINADSVKEACAVIAHQPKDNSPSTIFVALLLDSIGSGTIDFILPPANGGEKVSAEFVDTDLVSVEVGIDAYGEYSFEGVEYTSPLGETDDWTDDLAGKLYNFEVDASEGPATDTPGCADFYEGLDLSETTSN